MSSDANLQKGLFWTPRGGNNAKDIWASCHTFSSVTENKQTGHLEKTTLIVDLGQHEKPKDFLAGQFDKVVPALGDCLNVPGEPLPENKAQAVFLTHGHSDHIAGIYEYIRMGTRLPKIYASQHTLNALKKGFFENGIEKEQWPEMQTIKAGDVIQVGDMSVEAFSASHSIPGCFSFKISNSEGSIFHSGDTKADETSYLGQGVKLSSYQKIGRNGGVDLMTFDATATHMAGHASYESEIFNAYRQIFKDYTGKQVIAALPAAHMERLASVICAAQAAGRDVIINGGASMESNLLALKTSGYDLREKCPDIRIVSGSGKEVNTIDPEKSVTITTGIYQEEQSPFVRHLLGENPDFIMRNDAVVIAPTSNDKNEKLPLLLQEKVLKGVKIITGSSKYRIYGSGHAQADDFKEIARYIAPRTVAPIHCSAQKADTFNELASRNGYKTLPVYPHNGVTVSVDRKNGCRVVNRKEPQWIGLIHRGKETSFLKVGDNGYSTAFHDQDLVKARQQAAKQLIADYRNKKNLTSQVSLINRRKNER